MSKPLADMATGRRPNILVFGSCMSNLTAARLVSRYDFTQTHSIHHNRSDAFINLYIKKSARLIPLEELERHLVYKPASEREARQFLRNQYPEYLGFHDLIDHKRAGKTFFDDIEEQRFDLILLDNFMDVAAKLVWWKTREEFSDRKLFLNTGFYENEAELAPQFWHDDFLEPEVSVENWLTIFHWLRNRQPAAKIYFLPYQHGSSLSVPERFARIKRFSSLFAVRARGTGLRVLPVLNVRPSLMKGEIDWPHFADKVYEAMAGLIFLDYESNLLADLE